MKKDTQKINAVFEKDLTKILQDLGIYDDLMAGKLTCAFCRQPITYESIEYIFSDKGKIVISCNLQKCKEQLIILNNTSNGA